MTQPKAGDIAYFVTCVEGGDPFRVVVCYKYFPGDYLAFPLENRVGRWGWYNTQGITTRPLADDHSGLSRLQLLVRYGHPRSTTPHVEQFAEIERGWTDMGDPSRSTLDNHPQD